MPVTDPYCPGYPAPLGDRIPWWRRFLAPHASWLDLLQARSYRMKMGEVHLPGADFYLVNEPSLVRQVLETDEPAAFRRHPAVVQALRPLVGDSLFTAEGERWRRERRRLALALADGAARTRRATLEAGHALAARLRALAASPRGAVIDVEAQARLATGDAMLRAALSRDAGDPSAARLFASLSAFEAAASSLLSPSVMSFAMHAWHRHRGRAAARRVRAVLRDWIRPRLAAAPGARHDDEDLLAALLRARAEDGPALPEAAIDTAAMLLLGSHEPTASTLAWCLHLLARSPDVQRRLHEEAAAARAPGLDLPPLARAVVRETLRLYPPLGFLPRACAAAVTLRDKMLDVGDTVVVSPWLIHRHRALWDRPDAFDPDRYARSGDRPPAHESARVAWLPFGLGPHACPGATDAERQLVTLLGLLAREFAFEPAPREAPEPVSRLTVRSIDGIRLRVRLRAAREPMTP
jgi:cytochrome P450